MLCKDWSPAQGGMVVGMVELNNNLRELNIYPRQLPPKALMPLHERKVFYGREAMSLVTGSLDGRIRQL